MNERLKRTHQRQIDSFHVLNQTYDASRINLLVESMKKSILEPNSK